MAINYQDYLTNEQKKSLLNQRISQFAAEAWQHELNKKTCEELEDAEGVASALKALDTLNAAINVHVEELNNLPEE